MDSTVPWILAGLSAPVCVGKQVINVIQLVKASRWLAEGDVEVRRRERRRTATTAAAAEEGKKDT